MHGEKIEAALSAALNHVEDSIQTLSNNGDKKATSDSLWLASAETEYAVFLLSLVQGGKSENVQWKHDLPSKQTIEFKPTLIMVRELLNGAKAKVEKGTYEKGYEEAWKARILLLKTQELLDKKQKETKK